MNTQINPLDYVPDSLFMMCGHLEKSKYCDICSNKANSKLLNGAVNATEIGLAYCPFGKNDSMNKSIFMDQDSVNYGNTQWGRAPQMDPRPLSRIGLDWRTS